MKLKRGFIAILNLFFAIQTVLAAAPTVTSVDVPSNATYVEGQHLDFTVNWSESVTVGGTGTPYILVTIGSSTVNAEFTSVSGSSALIFSYTVTSGDEDVDGIVVGTDIELNSGTIQNGSAEDAILALNNVGSTNDVLVDAIVPVISSVGIPNVSMKVNDVVTATVTVTSDAEDYTASGSVSGEIGGFSIEPTSFAQNSDTEYTVQFTIIDGGTDVAAGSDIPVNLTIIDAAGNNSTAFTTAISQDSDALDANTPTVVITRKTPSDATTNAASLVFSVAFSESVSNVTSDDFTVNITDGAFSSSDITDVSASSGTLIDVTLGTVTGHGDLQLDLNGGTDISDAVGNVPAAASGESYAIDQTKPYISSTTFPSSPPKYEASDVLSFDLNWNENVYVSGGIPSFPIILDEGGTKAVVYTGGSETQTLTFEYTVVSGDKDDPSGVYVTGFIDLNGATIKDALGNDATLGFTGGNTNIKIDAKKPGITDVVEPANGYYRQTETLDFYVIFDKVVDVTGVPYIPITLLSGSVTADFVSITDDGTTSTLLFRHVVSTTDNDPDGIEIGSSIVLNGGTIKEGNNNAILTLTGVDPLTGVLVDAVLPALLSVGIVSTNANSFGTYAKAGDQITLSFAGSETLAAKPSVTIAGNAIASGSVTNPTGDNWEAVYTMGAGDAEGVVPFTIDFADLAGNTNGTVSSTTNSSSVTYYNTKPTLAPVSIASDHTNPERAKVGDIITIAFIADRELDDVSVSIFGNPATVTNVGDLYNWTATYTTQSGDLEGAIPFTVDFYDLPLNQGNQVSTTTDGSSVSFDKTPPQLNSVTIKSDHANSEYVGEGGIVILSITGSEGLGNSPVVTINGHNATVAKVAGSSINWKASYVMGSLGSDTDGDVTFAVDFVDLSGNNGSQVSTTTDGSAVTFVKTAPALTAISIASDHTNDDMARLGSAVHLSFTSTDTIENVNVKINGKAVLAESVSENSWVATGYLSASDPAGNVAFSIDYMDIAGNMGTQETVTSDGSKVTFDKTNPNYSLVSIYSDNSNSAYAVDGDLVTLEFVTSETVEAPEVFINGQAPDDISGGPTNWLATRIVATGEDEGVMPFTINIQDLAGNTPITKFNTTDGSAVKFDDSNPVISSVTVDPGVYKVGDVISILIQSDDISYTGVTVEVNGKTQGLNNNLNNTYSINYLVEENDNEILNADQLPVNIVLVDPAGLTTSRTEADVNGGTITIDSRTPVISTFSSNAEAPGNAIIGSSIIFTMVPAVPETGLHVQPSSYNGVPLVWTTTDGSVYTAIYQVGEGDPEQSTPLQPGLIVLSDDAGNASTTSYTAVAKKIYTTFPTAKISGTTSKCDYGQTVPITFQFTGRRPFTFSYSNGTETIGPVVRDAFSYTINELQGHFTLVNLTDSTGNFVTEETEYATISVVPLPEVTTNYSNSPYNIESPADKLSQYVLEADKRGGIFNAQEGIGYSNGDYYFYPGNIPDAMLDQDIPIIYTYTDPNTGCFTKDTNTVFVSSTPIRIVGLKSAYCDYNEPVTITGNLPIQHTGRFDIYDADSTVFTTGWVEVDSVTLILDPRQMPPGEYIMNYTAIKYPENVETEFRSTKYFSIEATRTGIQLTGLSEEYCFDSLSPSIPVNLNFIPAPGDISDFFGADVFKTAPGEHTARFELAEADADTSYSLYYVYTSLNGCTTDTVHRTVSINPLPKLSYSLENNYNYDQGSIPLTGIPLDPKYNFSGEGVSNNTLFTAAARVGAPIIITFSGRDDNGCFNQVIDTTIIYRANETIEGLTVDGVYCYEDTVLDISCTPNISDTITGTFRSMRNALEPNGKNGAKYYLDRIGSGEDTVYFDYCVQGTNYTVKKVVFIDSIGDVTISSSTSDFDYCHSVPLVQFTGNQNYTFGGEGKFEYIGSNGVPKITRSSSTSIYPVAEVPGTYSISYSYTSSRGCYSSTSQVINIFPEPVTDFFQSITCPDLTTPVPFNNLTTFSGNESELSWSWSFEGGLPVTEKSPVYTFQANGVKQVTLTATTDKGCAVSKSREYTIGNFAKADFRWDNECNTGGQVTLTSTSLGGVAENADYTWKVDGTIIPGTISASHQFSGIGEYDISLLYLSDDGCVDSVTKTMVFQPYIRLKADLPEQIYYEDFESGDELYTWQTRGLTVSDTTRWNLGAPDGNVINNTASGSHSWYLRADRSDVENSEVVSPCFDLSGLEKPMIKLNIWSSSEFKRDGAVMQYSIDFGNTWTNLGAVNQGVNWFNSENIQSQPGGDAQFIGWNEVRMEDWRSARYNLDFLKDESNVRFRIAYAADGGGLESVDGFAFDDVWIGDRQQNVLTEYFTNTSVIGSDETDATIFSYEKARAADLVPIHYHTGNPSGDVLFSDYKEGPSGRVFYYGVTSLPEVISNGVIHSYLDAGTIDLFRKEVNVESLKDPNISIDMSVSHTNAEVTITAREDLSGESLLLFAAVVKDSVEVDGSRYYHVLRKFLPDPAGVILPTDDFTIGKQITEVVSLDLSNSALFTRSNLVVFVQNSNSKEVYQSAISDLGLLTSTSSSNISNSVDIYPNPVVERLFIDSRFAIRRLVIADITGRVIHVMEPDQERIELSIENYKYGVYMIRGITDEGEFMKKFIKQ